MVNIQRISYAVHTVSKSASFPIKLSHAQQLVAAALGYKSLAAYQKSLLEASCLKDTAHFVLDGELLTDRAQQLGLPYQSHDLTVLIRRGFKACLPNADIHQSMDELYNYITNLVEDQVLNDSSVSGEISTTNGDGVDEVYIPVDEFVMEALPPLGQPFNIELDGHVAMNIDDERPYSGHIIHVKAILIIERTGKVSIVEPICEVVNAGIDYNWGDDNHHLLERPLAEALAEELELKLSEAKELVDAEPIENVSSDGLVYGYTFDFTHHASPAVATKIQTKYGSLMVEVPSWFFEGVRSTAYE